MSEPKISADQQRKTAAQEKRGTKSFTTIWSGTKEKYKANARKAYVESKKWFSGQWWFQDEPVGRFTGWVAIFTGFLVVVSFLQFCTLQSTDKTAHDTLVATSRAWVGPLNATMSNPVKGQALSITVNYRNSGREPALNLISFHTSEWYPLVDWTNGHAAKDIKAVAAACMKFTPTQDISVAYPSSGESYYTSAYKTDDDNLGAKYLVTDDLISGKEIYTSQGCFAYRTLQEAHHSAFCFFYQAGVTSGLPNMSFCTVGNDAD